MPALVIAIAPIVYLVVRGTAGGGLQSLEAGTIGTAAIRTLVLALLVAIGAVGIGVPLAVLTIRTDFPLRRIALILGALPLVIPSYVGALALLGALGPRGLLAQALEPFGVFRLPTVDGLLGSYSCCSPIPTSCS